MESNFIESLLLQLSGPDNESDVSIVGTWGKNAPDSLYVC